MEETYITEFYQEMGISGESANLERQVLAGLWRSGLKRSMRRQNTIS